LEAALKADPGDHLGWCRAHQLRSMSWLLRGQVGRAEEAMRAAIARARELGDRYEEERLLIAHCELAQWSPSPIERGLALCVELGRRFAEDRTMLVVVLLTRARLLALRGDLTQARTLLDDAIQHVDDLRLELARVAVTQTRALVEALAGGHVQAERLYGAAARDLLAMGHQTAADTLRVYAARERVRAGAPPEEVIGQLPRERLELRAELAAACLHARAGSHEHEEIVLRLLERTDDPCLRGDALTDLAHVRHEQRQTEAAVQAAEAALALYRARGATLPATRLAAWLASLRQA
jgi:tetratricopeptide (TPR) repeat protein